MSVLDLARRHLVASASAGGVVLGVAVGLLQPIHASAPDAAALGQWLPYGKMALDRFDPARFSALRGARIWGDTGGPGAAASRWSLTGIIANPQPAALVVAQGSTKVQALQVAGKLPDGGTIVEITERSVRFTREGCTYERALYSAPDPAEGAGCDPGAAPAQKPAQKQVPER